MGTVLLILLLILSPCSLKTRGQKQKNRHCVSLSQPEAKGPSLCLQSIYKRCVAISLGDFRCFISDTSGGLADLKVGCGSPFVVVCCSCNGCFYSVLSDLCRHCLLIRAVFCILHLVGIGHLDLKTKSLYWHSGFWPVMMKLRE